MSKRTSTRAALPTTAESSGRNLAVIAGVLSSRPRPRDLPSGDELLNLEISTKAAGSRSASSVPIVWFGPPEWAHRLDAGDSLVVVGSVRRRFFKAAGATMSRTEVVVDRAAPAGAAHRVRKVLDRARSALLDEQS